MDYLNHAKKKYLKSIFFLSLTFLFGKSSLNAENDTVNITIEETATPSHLGVNVSNISVN